MKFSHIKCDLYLPRDIITLHYYHISIFMLDSIGDSSHKETPSVNALTPQKKIKIGTLYPTSLLES